MLTLRGESATWNDAVGGDGMDTDGSGPASSPDGSTGAFPDAPGPTSIDVTAGV